MYVRLEPGSEEKLNGKTEGAVRSPLAPTLSLLQGLSAVGYCE